MVGGNIRHRAAREDNFSKQPKQNGSKKRTFQPSVIGYGIPNFVGIVVFIGSLVYAVHVTETFLPISKPSTSPANEFSGDRASKHLFDITKLGPRTAGSYANDISAVRVIVNALEDIKKKANSNFEFEIDLQTETSGSFAFVRTGLIDIGYTITYNNISNIVVKLSSKKSKSKSYILVNAHFDTVPNTEGASDDTVSCAVMLETLRAFSQSDPDSLNNGMIFLFNGAEEGPLGGSHAFIKGHKWKDLAKVVINLEAAGSGLFSFVLLISNKPEPVIKFG